MKHKFSTPLRISPGSAPAILTAAISALLASHSLQAASATWNASPTNGFWEATGAENNWSTGAGTFPGALSDLVNTGTATFLTSGTNAIVINSTAGNATPLGIQNITFGAVASPSAFTIGTVGGNSLLLASGGTISIASGVTVAGATETINAPLVLEPASATTAGAYTFSNASGLAGSILKIGGTVTGGTTSAGITLNLTGASTTANEISGIISDGGATGKVGITKTSSGNWILSGNNTFTGAITFNAGGNNPNGNIRLASSNALGQAATTNTITMTTSTNLATGAVELTNNITVAGKNFTIGGRSIGPSFAFLRNVSGSNAFNGNITISNSGGGYSVEVVSGSTLALGGTIANNVASSTRGLVFHGDGTTNISGAINNSGGTTSLEKKGTGTMTISGGSNTYSGGTTVTVGSLNAKRTTQIALGTGAVSVASGANLTITDHAGGGQLPYTNNFTLTGSGISGGGALNFFNSGAFNMSGTLAIAGGATFRTDPQTQSAAGTVTFTNTISGSGGLTLFAQGGNAAGIPGFAFTGASNYSGDTLLTSSGINTAPFIVTLSGANDRLPIGTVLTFGGTPAGTPAGTFNKSVTLALNGISQQVAGISTANSPATAGGYRIIGASATPSTLVVNNPAAPASFSGIIGGAGTNENNLGLSKLGADTLSLNAVDTYSGPTSISNGTLALGASASISNTPSILVATPGIFNVSAVSGWTLGSGQVLTGDGTVNGPVLVSGSVSPGQTVNSVATLNFGSAVTFNSGSTYAVTIAQDGLSNDRINATGALAISSTIAVTFAGATPFTPVNGSQFDIVDASSISGTPTVTGTLPSGLAWDTSDFTTTGKIKVVSTGSPYTIFVSVISNPADRDPADDPDADGLCNGVEFVVGGDPSTTSDAALAPTSVLVTADVGNGTTDYLKFTFRRTDNSAYLNPSAEYNTDLTGPWTTATAGVNGVVIVTTNDGAAVGVDLVEVYIPRSLAVSGKLFARLDVAVTP